MAVQLHQTEENLRLAVSLARIGTWHWDLVRNELTWDETCKMMFGVPLDTDITYEVLLNVLHPDDRQRAVHAIYEALATRQDYNIDYRAVWRDGTIRWINTKGRATFDEDGKPLEMAGVAIDITDRKNAEEALVAARAEAEQHARNLDQAAAELARTNKDLELFAYSASHDLQEPLRMISSYVHLLETRYKDHLDESANEYIAFAVDGAERMQQLLRDLLAYSRASSRELQVTQVNCQTVFEEVLRNLAVSIRTAEAAITNDPLPEIRCDRTQYALLLQNLISNAIKFRHPHRRPEIHVAAFRESAGWGFWVRDNGIGIPADQHERVFKAFQRLHSRSQYPGTGIGLAICKRIVERHGGQIEFESREGEGTAFYFTIPDRSPS